MNAESCTLVHIPAQPGSGHSLHRLLRPPLFYVHPRAVCAYRPAPYPGCVTYFRAIGPQDRMPQLLPDGGWGRVAQGGVKAYDIRGNHCLINEPFVAELARVLSCCLDVANTAQANAELLTL
jgi:hypothetical protein